MTDEEAITKALREEFTAHLQQASKTPFAQTGIDIKTREIIFNQTDNWKTSINYLEWELADEVAPLPSTSYHLEPQQLIDGFRKWSEKKSTSPSGRSLSLYKILTQKTVPDEEEYYQNFFEDLFTDIINISITHEVVLPLWRHVNSILLPKDSFQLHRFRLLNLFEADCNLTLREIIAKILRNKAENTGLESEQWGGRHQHSSIDMGLITILTLDVLMTKTQAGYVDLEASACFDRMIRSVAMISLYCYGGHTKFLRWYLRSMDKMLHQLVTAFGIDVQTFPDDETQFEGIGQGSTSAGHIWNFIDILIIKKYKKHVQKLILTCPQAKILIQKILDSFVDDRKVWVPGSNNTIIASRIQSYVELLQNLLVSTGGGLNLQKCKWMILNELQE